VDRKDCEVVVILLLLLVIVVVVVERSKFFLDRSETLTDARQ